MSDFDPYHKWMGISREEQPPNHYRLLGIRLFEDDGDVIQNAADQRMAHLRNFQLGHYAEFSQRLLNEVSAARLCLLRPSQKQEYDARLRAQIAPRTAPPPEPPPLPGSLRPQVPLAHTAAPPVAVPLPDFSGAFADLPVASHASSATRRHKARDQTALPGWMLATVAGGLLLGGATLVYLAMSSTAPPRAASASTVRLPAKTKSTGEAGKSDLADAEPTAAPPPTPPPLLRGLLGEYFRGVDKEAVKVTQRIDSQINFLWEHDSPGDEIPADHFTVRWKGYIKAPRPGRYQFTVDADDELTLKIDERVVCQTMLDDAAGEAELTGKPQAIALELREWTFGAHAVVCWSLPGVYTKAVIPAEALFADLASAESALVPESIMAPIPGVSAAPGKEAVDLLGLIDPGEHAIAGNWWFDGKALVCGRQLKEPPHDKFATLQIPFAPPVWEYRLTAVVEQLMNHDVLQLSLATEQGFPTAGIDSHPHENWRTAIYGVVNEPRYRFGRKFVRDKLHTVEYTVDRGGIEVTVNGNTAISWVGNVAALPPDEIAGIKSGRFLLRTWDTSYRVHKLMWEPLTTD